LTALLEGDQEAMQRQARWIEEHPGEDGMFILRLHEAFYRGQFQKGRQLLEDLVILIRQQEREELAEALQREQAWVEGIVGNRQLVDHNLSLPVEVESTHLDQVIVCAYTLALMGESQQVEKILEAAIELYPEATLLKNLHAPTIRAMMDHRRGDSEAALRRLRTVARYENAPQADKFKLIRGQILLDLKRGDEAVEAFRKIVDYPGQIAYLFREPPVSSWIEIPLAHVGLARAKAITGDTAGARKAYEAFFELWKDADPDIPLLQDAKAQYTKLRASG
jgi:tetratricopeptide (TPR) repeat protein